MKVGQISDILESEQGYHILTLTQYIPVKTKPFEKSNPPFRTISKTRRKALLD
jgi:parvulin-like peptidyl-prolyl isomerase